MDMWLRTWYRWQIYSPQVNDFIHNWIGLLCVQLNIQISQSSETTLQIWGELVYYITSCSTSAVHFRMQYERILFIYDVITRDFGFYDPLCILHWIACRYWWSRGEWLQQKYKCLWVDRSELKRDISSQWILIWLPMIAWCMVRARVRDVWSVDAREPGIHAHVTQRPDVTSGRPRRRRWEAAATTAAAAAQHHPDGGVQLHQLHHWLRHRWLASISNVAT